MQLLYVKNYVSILSLNEILRRHLKDVLIQRNSQYVRERKMSYLLRDWKLTLSKA